MSGVPSSDVAYRILRLEQQLDSYQRLHAEELEQIRQALAELKDLVLGQARKDVAVESTSEPRSP